MAALAAPPIVGVRSSFSFTLQSDHSKCNATYLGRVRSTTPSLGLLRLCCKAANDPITATPASEKDAVSEERVPLPIVIIDQDLDPHATVVELSFGDRLGALVDTMKALKDLGLNVVKGTVTSEGPTRRNKFSITRMDTGRKVEDPEVLESIRLTIISNLLKYHPESSEQLAMGEAFGIKPPPSKPNVDITTHVEIIDDGPTRSLLTIQTADKPGLLLEIIQIITDISVHVESAWIDTEGLLAKDKFHVSYGGAALSKSMAKVLTNCLRYHLRRPESEDESY